MEKIQDQQQSRYLEEYEQRLRSVGIDLATARGIIACLYQTLSQTKTNPESGQATS